MMCGMERIGHEDKALFFVFVERLTRDSSVLHPQIQSQVSVFGMHLSKCHCCVMEIEIVTVKTKQKQNKNFMAVCTPTRILFADIYFII
jgi:hypothetical protein